jgi:hypothetical protein
MAFKDLYEYAKKQGASTQALKQIDDDARRLTGLGVTDRVVPTAPVVPSVTIPQPTTTPTVKQPEAVAPTQEEKEVPSKKDAAKTTMEQAAKAYDDYIKSDEYKQRLQEAENKAKLDAAAQATFGPGTNVSLTPQTIRDEKAEQLRAARDQAEADYNRSLDEEVMAADLAAIADLTDEERSMLELYVIKRNEYQNLPVEMKGYMPTPEQHASALIQKYGNKRVNELAESFTRQQNADIATQVEEVSRQFADEHGFLGSVLTVPVEAVSSITGIIGRLQEAARSTGRYRTLDANEIGTLGDVFTGTVRGQVQQNIEGEDPNLLRKAASVGYQGIMSLADAIARGYLGGGAIGAGVLAATSTFSQTMSEASRNGATPAQAAALATVNSAIEAATEAIPLDELIKTAKGQGAGTVLKNVLRNAGIEATAEELSLVGTFLAEAAIMQEQSGYQQEVRDLILGGMSPEAARETANRNLLNEAVNTALVAGFSGGMSSVGASIADAKNIPTPPTIEQVADMMLGDMAKPKQAQNAAPVETAPETSGGTLNGEELLSAMGLDKIINSGGTVTNSMAEQILRDPEALDIILQETATQLVGSRAAQRAQIKNAVYQLAGVQPESDTAPVQQPAAQQAPTQQPPVQQAPQQQTQAPTNTRQQKNAVYAELQHAVAAQKDLQKKIDKAEAKVASGKGSAAYLAQLKAQMEQQTKRVDQLRSQNDYFGGDYDTTVEKAAQTQQAVFEQARQEAIDAKNAFNEGRISKAQYDAAQQKYNTAGQELFRLKNMTQEQYAEELASVGLVADRQPENVTPTKAVPAQQQEAPQVTQQPEAVQPQAQTPQQQTTAEAPTAAQQWSAPQTDMQTAPDTATPEQQVPSTTGTQLDYRDSNTYMNTGINSTNPNIRAGYRQELRENPDAARYAVKHNADTLAEARSRVSTPENANAALDDLLAKDVWTPEDVATSTLLLDQIMASGDRDAIAKLNDLRRRRKDTGVQAGQVAQSFSINNSTMRNADSPATAVDTFRSNLDSMSESETTYNPKSGVDFETWKQNIQEDVERIGIAIATVEDGDADSMRDIIKQIARARKTTAWFGTSNNVTATANRILGKLDFEDLKKIANTQVAAMADDYRKRGAGEVAGTIRKQNMLSSLKTFARNIGGNIAGGFGDAVSESGAGQLADLMLSKFTGKRTVGNDLTRGKEYARAAKEAAQFASLCVELNIPIETDADSSFSVASGKESNQKYVGRTFRATGNPAMRALYAYQKYMSYALEVTDKIFEGGSNAAVQESLARLQNANLTEQEAEALGQFAANKRTFKNATWEEGGKTRGAEMARLASSVRDIGRGTKAEPIVNAAMDVAMPFTNVPMNVAQTGIDYTAGVAKSIGEMISIIKDVKAGKTIPVERQRQAASDFGRGVTGTAMVGMFAAAAAMGVLKASDDDDWNKEALAQAEGRSGAQINWSALMRGLNGESAKWQKGDIITGMDFLEPFNTQMYLGAELANTEDMNLLKRAGATVKSVWNSLMDSPVMTGLSDIVDTIKELGEAETAGDVANVAAGYAGDVASSFIPQYVRQTAQEMDGYYRDTRGETPVESAANSVKSALPWLSETLPKKYSGLGEVQERGSAFETFADPTATKRYNPNEVTTYLDKLNEATGDDSIYPERQAPMKVKVDGEDVKLDGPARETYQKTYGENVATFYGDLINRPDFQSLTGEQQAEALKLAESYAAELAKKEVVDGYEIENGWMDNVSGSPADEIIRKTVQAEFNSALGKKQTPEKMEAAYNAYKALPPDQRKVFMDEAEGETKNYLIAKNAGMNEAAFTEVYDQYKQIADNDGLETDDKSLEWNHYLQKAKEKGLITEAQRKTLDDSINFYYHIQVGTPKYDKMIAEGIRSDTAANVARKMDDVVGTGANGTVRDIDTRGAVADAGLPDAETDRVMHAIMGDYDPNAEKKEYSELKYDYIRHGLGLTPQEYINTYRAYLDGASKEEDIRGIMRLGFDKEMATMLYNVYRSTAKGKAAYLDFYESRQ